MVKKKSGNKKTNNTTSTIPPATNGGTSDATSPTASSFAKEDQEDVSEPVQDEPKNATSPTEKNSTTDAATTAAPLSKSQKKKAAAARKAAAAALATDSASSQQPTITEEVDTPTTPIDSSEEKSNMTKPPSDEPEASEPLKDTAAPEPEKDLQGDAWGLNEGEPSKADDDVAEPAADEAPAPGAQDRSSADGIQVATTEPKLEDDVHKDTEVSNADEAAESLPPPPVDAAPNSSNDATDPDASDVCETKNDAVIPSTEVTEDTTKPNGEPMDAPPRPSDDDNRPLSQFPIREKPIVDTSFPSNGLASDSTTKQTPSLAGENPGSSQSGSGSSITGINSHSRTDAPSTSPTSGVPARGPTAVGFGAAAPQTPTTTPGFGFGFGSPQGSIPKTASGMSWSSSPPKPSPKPAPKTGWGWFNKARESIEQVIGDEPSASPRAPVDRPAQSPLVGPSNSNSNPNATPASPSRPTKGMSAFEVRMAALSKKAATGPNKDSAPAPTPETPKTSSFAVPPSDPGVSPISPVHSTQSYTQSHPSPLPLPPSTSEPTEQTAPQTPDQAVVTSAFPSPPRENTAETGNVGKLIAKFDGPETPVSSKTATTGLRLHTQSIVPDGPVGASPLTKRASIGSETERPSLPDMRSSFAPTPRTPITSASPRTPSNFTFGPGLGTTNRLAGGGLRFAGGGFAGFRQNHAPSPISTPLTENEPKLGNQNDRDDLSSLIEGSEPQDLDSQIGESEPQDVDSLIDDSGLDGLANIPLNIDVDSPAIPTTFNTTIPDVAPSYANPWDSSPFITAEVLPATTLEVTAPLPSPTKSEFGPDAAIPDDKTIADPSDLADVTPEPVPKDEPQPESPIVSEHVVTPVAEKPAEVPSFQERVVEELAVPPVVEESATSPIADEPTVPPVVDEPTEGPVLHDEALVPELTEPAAVLEPQVDEPPPAISTEETPEAPKEPVAEPVIETVVEPTIEPSVEPATSVIEPAVEPAAELAVELVVEPEPAVEVVADVIPESSPEPTMETVVEPAVELTPQPTVQPVVELPELVVAPSVEVISEPVAEPPTVEPSIELSSETVTEPAVEPVATVVESAVKPVTEVVAESIPEAIPEPAELAIEIPVELSPEPVAQPVVEPSEPTVVPLFEPATTASTLEPSVEPSPEPAVEPVVEPIAPVVESAVVEPVEVVVEPTPKVIPESASEPTIETPVEPTPEPVVRAVVEPAEPTVVPLVEPAAIAPTLEPTVEPSVEALLASPIEPPVPESAPVLPTETTFEKSEPPKLSLDVPSAGKSSKSKSKSKLKSPVPPTPITPTTPATSGKKNGKNGKSKGKKSKNGKKEEVATSEPIPIVPESASQSEPASKPELISQFVPGSTPVEPEAEPIRDEARAGSVTPTPIESKVELIPEVVELAPIVEVSPPPQAPEEPEPTPEDVPPTPVENTEQPEAEIVEFVEPAVVELAVVEPPVIPVVAEPAAVESAVESAVVEPVSIEPIAIEPVSVEPVLAESAMVDPVADKPLEAEPAAVESVEVTLPPTTEGVTKNEDNRTATPDEDFETPKVAPRELPELVPEPIEVTPQTFVFETPIEATIIPPAEAESSPEPILLPPLTEVYAEFIPALEPQPEPEPEPVAVPIVEPTVDPVVEAVTEPPVDAVVEVPVELASEPVPEQASVPTVKPVAELTITPSTEDIAIEDIQPVAEVVPELQVQPPVEPVFEVAVSPVVEAPKEEEPTPEVHHVNPSPSKSSKKRRDKKKKGTAKAVVTEEPVLSPVNDDSVMEVVKPEVPITSTLEDSKASNEIVVLPAVAPMEESSGKTKVISVVSTPVEETLPTLPLSADAPMALVDTPQIEEMEEALVTTIQTIEVLESPIQTEVTPEIEVIELPDDQGTEAASTISVAQIHPEVTMSTPLTLPAIEFAPIELVPDVLSEPEPVPVLVDLPQSPVTSALSALSPRPSTRPITPSLWPHEPFLANREASPPRSVTPNTDKHHETLAVLQIPANPIRIPARPVLEHVVSAEATIPLSASPISDSASQSSQDIGSSGREDSGVPRESQPLRRTGSVSSITSIDTDSPSAVDKPTMRPSMPPLISIPVPSPVATSSPYLGSLTQRSSPERKSSAKSDERPAPSTATDDLPTNDVPSQFNTNAKPSSSRILDNFSPLRWFGFGGLPTPAVENKPVEVRSVEAEPVEAPVEVNSVEVSPVEVKLVEVKPVNAHPVETNPIEIKPVEIKPVEPEPEPIETKPVEIKATEAKPVETNLVEVRSVEVHSVVAPPADPKTKDDREKQPKSTPVPIRKAASPPCPESPIMEKTGWSRWPYQPTMITSIPPVKARVPLARDSIPAPTRADGHVASPRSGRVPPISTMPPIIPISPIPAGSPSAPARSDAPHSRRSHRTNGQATHLFSTPVHVQATSTDEEKRERPGKRSSHRATSPMLNPVVALQSPRSSEDSLPAYTSQAPSVDRDPKPVPRGILKQRITPPATPPEAETPTTVNSARATPEPSKFEFAGLRSVPSYDLDYSSVRKDTSNTSVPRSREVQPPLATMAPHSSRSRTMGDSNHRSRSKHSSKELGSLPNKVNHPRTPSPLRETRATPKTAVTPPKPNLVPVSNEKIIRTKVPKPAKISTARTTGNAYIQPLTSPILLTSENYGARQPENKVYQYDVRISPSESLSPTSRKAIFDILQKQVAPQVFPILARPNFDGKKMLYAQRRLNVSSKQEFSVELLEHGQEPRVYTVQLKRLAVITPQIALTFR